MTYSTTINSTITKETEATKARAGSSKSEMVKKRKTTKKRAVVKVSKDIYQLVTDRIIAALESGVKPWACPWDRTNECSMLPMNFKTKANYSGVNILLLWSETVMKGFSSPYWLTYNQAVELGGNVIKGQKGTSIIFYKNWEKENDDGKMERIPMLKSFTVFNIDQVEGIEKPTVTVAEVREKNEFVTLDHVVEAINATEIKINHCGVQAFYSSTHDEITLPMVDRFNSSCDYYATAWHELVHATAHKTRLDRNLKNSFGSKDYAFEELIAELGSAFCCADLGIVGEVQHENYIASWLERLNGDKKFIFKAASQATKAHQWLFKKEATQSKSKEVVSNKRKRQLPFNIPAINNELESLALHLKVDPDLIDVLSVKNDIHHFTYNNKKYAVAHRSKNLPSGTVSLYFNSRDRKSVV